MRSQRHELNEGSKSELFFATIRGARERLLAQAMLQASRAKWTQLAYTLHCLSEVQKQTVERALGLLEKTSAGVNRHDVEEAMAALRAAIEIGPTVSAVQEVLARASAERAQPRDVVDAQPAGPASGICMRGASKREEPATRVSRARRAG